MSAGPRARRDRLTEGRGTFVADWMPRETLEVAFLRSPFAHARIGRVSVDETRRLAGVETVISGEDLQGKVTPFPDFFPTARPARALPLCTEVARYVGAPVAAVVAEDRYKAEDALETIDIDYLPLPVVSSAEQALSLDSARLYPDWPDNIMVSASRTDPDVERIFSTASRVVEGRYVVHRHGPVPLEGRGILAVPDGGRLHVWASTQVPHVLRTTLSQMLPVSESDIRVTVPDVGGAFGAKLHIYPEDVVVCWAALELGKPIRWIEDRREHLMATNHARQHTFWISAVVDERARIEALRYRIVSDVGSGEIFPGQGLATAFVASAILTGPYAIDHAEMQLECVVTNKTPSGAYRGFGHPEAVFAIERIMEKIASELQLDPIEVRRRNIIRSTPFVMPSGATVDSGSHLQCLDRAAELGADALEQARSSQDSDGQIGLGIACYVEGVAASFKAGTGFWTSHESCNLRIEPDGKAVVSVGTSEMGQGLYGMFSLLVSRELAIDPSWVRVVMGDTDLCPYGLGSWGSRSTIMGGGAVIRAARAARKKMCAIAAHLLEASPGDIEPAHGRFVIKGSPEAGVQIERVAQAALITTTELPDGMEPGLEFSAIFDPPNLMHAPDDTGRMNGATTYANAAHAAVVEVDRGTGQISLLRYIVVHDCGTVLQPEVVAAQILGGVAQGIGGALLEQFLYDEEAQPLCLNLMDYLLPTVKEMPPVSMEHFESPALFTELGVKGVGEGGAIGPFAAVANAVADALSHRSLDISELPIVPGFLAQRSF